jgi:Na+/melibiose symporter-like transporter
MKENERFAGHIVFLTIGSAISTALIAALAAIFADPGKIRSLDAKHVILGVGFFAVAGLVASLWASVKLSNYLVSADEASTDDRRKEKAAQVTIFSGLASFALGASAVLLLIFLYVTLSRAG